MKLYIADYHVETTDLDVVGHGAYLLLLMAMWRAGGKLPRDDGKLSRLAKCTPEQWASVRADVMAHFKVAGGAIKHARVEKEIAKYKAVVDGASEAGKASAAKKANKSKRQASTDVSESANDSPTNQNLKPELKEEPPLPPGGDRPLEKPIAVRKADVEAIWSASPKRSRERSSKADVEQALISAARRGRQPAAILAGLQAYFATPSTAKDDYSFVKGVHRMIEKDRWEAFTESSEPAPSIYSPPPPPADMDAVWRRRVGEFTRNLYWNDDWTERPGKPGCNVPEHILAEFGLGGADVLPFPPAEQRAGA